MKQAQRWREAKLESTIARVEAAEKRALADLQAAGYHFHNIQGAKQHLARLRKLRRLGGAITDDVLAVALATVEKNQKRETA